MFGILAGVVVFVVIALGVLAFFEIRQSENEQTETEQKEAPPDNQYAKLFAYREQLLNNDTQLTQDILNHPEVAKREMLYWLENLGKEDPQYTVWFLLNVCEKVEYGNPRVVKAMRNSVRKDTVQMYDLLKDHLYKVWHGEA